MAAHVRSALIVFSLLALSYAVPNMAPIPSPPPATPTNNSAAPYQNNASCTYSVFRIPKAQDPFSNTSTYFASVVTSTETIDCHGCGHVTTMHLGHGPVVVATRFSTTVKADFTTETELACKPTPKSESESGGESAKGAQHEDGPLRPGLIGAEHGQGPYEVPTTAPKNEPGSPKS